MCWDFPFAGYGWLTSWCAYFFPLLLLAFLACMYMACRRRFSFPLCCGQGSVSPHQLSAELHSMRDELEKLRKELKKPEGFM
jgi:hypothetical protein